MCQLLQGLLVKIVTRLPRVGLYLTQRYTQHVGHRLDDRWLQIAGRGLQVSVNAFQQGPDAFPQGLFITFLIGCTHGLLFG
jgi:hypothetical protein